MILGACFLAKYVANGVFCFSKVSLPSPNTSIPSPRLPPLSDIEESGVMRGMHGKGHGKGKGLELVRLEEVEEPLK